MTEPKVVKDDVEAAMAEACIRYPAAEDGTIEIEVMFKRIAFRNGAMFALDTLNARRGEIGECICPKCGIRHGGSHVEDAGF